MAIHLADYGLSVQSDEDARRRDAILIRMAKLHRVGGRLILPPINGRLR